MRLLVFGGRDFVDQRSADYWLDLWHELRPISVVIHGAYRGADTCADRWAKRRGVDRLPFAADWGAYGPAAGPRRNTRMLEEGRPDAALGLPGGPGSADMARKAAAAGLCVTRVGRAPPLQP